jgi:transcriptional regulator with GAF, ATPase, and Fis domain
MRRRSSAGGEATKARRRKTAPQKRSIAPNAVRSSSDATQETELARVIRERDEALARQIATSEILRVISQSPTDVQHVFDSIVLTAARLLRCDLVFVLLCDGATYTAVAVASPEGCDRRQKNAAPTALLRARPFTEKQIELATTFADQAVIAIENTRLFEAEQQRTRELTQSLEQQTATSEVLQVISSSPGDLEPVFEAMLEKAVRICDANFGSLYLGEDGKFRLVAAYNVPDFFEARRDVAYEPVAGGLLDEAMRTKRAVQIPDLAATEAYLQRHPRMVDAVELAGMRTGMAVPMLKDDEVIGIIVIHRREVLPFPEKQIELLANFAAQAVIAIEKYAATQ